MANINFNENFSGKICSDFLECCRIYNEKKNFFFSLAIILSDNFFNTMCKEFIFELFHIDPGVRDNFEIDFQISKNFYLFLLRN